MRNMHLQQGRDWGMYSCYAAMTATLLREVPTQLAYGIHGFWEYLPDVFPEIPRHYPETEYRSPHTCQGGGSGKIPSIPGPFRSWINQERRSVYPPCLLPAGLLYRTHHRCTN